MKMELVLAKEKWKVLLNFVSLARPINWNSYKFIKGCLPQVLLGPFLNTLFQLLLRLAGFVRLFIAN